MQLLLDYYTLIIHKNNVQVMGSLPKHVVLLLSLSEIVCWPSIGP